MWGLLLLVCLVGGGETHPPSGPSSLVEWCGGRIICTDEQLEDRVCLLSDAALDLRRVPPVSVYLSNSRPAILEPGALSVKECEDGMPTMPLLSNAFGLMSSSRVYGELEVMVNDTEACWLRPEVSPVDPECFALGLSPNDRLECLRNVPVAVRVLLNRDMNSNVFHVLYNNLYPLFRVKQAFGLNMASTSLLVIDPMPLTALEKDLYSALLGPGGQARLEHWPIRPFPAHRLSYLCQPALAVGANRHWRTWLHEKAQFGVLQPFASWIADAFNLPAPVPKQITVIDRKGFPFLFTFYRHSYRFSWIRDAIYCKPRSACASSACRVRSPGCGAGIRIAVVS